MAKKEQQQQDSTQQQIREFLKTDRAILMICIGIAFVFWLVTKLSYNYKDALVVDLNYNLPPNKVFTLPSAEQLDIDIEGSGWELLSLAFSGKKPILNINANEEENINISSSSLKSKVLDFVAKTKIVHITPENIQLQTEESATKEIPIILDYQIGLVPLHQFSDSIQISPQILEIKGPASIIKEINEWESSPLILQNVKKTIQTTIALKMHPNSNVKFSKKNIDVLVPIEEITEKEIEVAIEVLNAPDSLLMVVLPKKIKISCRVGLSAYDRLVASDFRAIIDFKNVDLFNQKQVKVLLKKSPSYIKRVHYKPQKVDFIIRKN